MLKIAQNLSSVKERIINAEKNYNRTPNSVKCIGLTTKQPMGKLKVAADEGLVEFGESHLQEALAKLSRLKPYGIHWHFLGPIQANKAEVIANYFHWAHNVGRVKDVLRLNEFRADNLEPINILLEVNVDDLDQNNGIAFEELKMAADFIKDLPRIKLRGLTASPMIRREFELQREPFKKMREAFETLKLQGHANLDTLSIGKSHDFEAAIAEGSTLVRIGTAIFGESDTH